MKKSHYLIGVTTVALTYGLYIEFTSSTPATVVSHNNPKSQNIELSTHQTLPQPTLRALVQTQPINQIPAEVYQTLPNSLRGAPLPQALQVDEQGQLVINQQIQMLFDFYLTATGEESLELIIARIKHQLQQQLTDPALTESIAILEGYLQYRNHIGQLISEAKLNPQFNIDAPDTVKQLKKHIADARDRFFSPEVIEAFFADQDQYDHYMQAQQTLNSDSQLTAIQKQQAQTDLLQQAPDWLRQQQQTANRLNLFRQQRQQLYDRQASAAELQDLRDRTFTVEAADRLADLEIKRQRWHARIEQYHQQLATVFNGTLNRETLNNETSRQQISHLREQYFTGSEILRIATIDQQKFGF